ncbi:MAG: TonB-dependent receptor [Gemmatimonadaceae bacterium]|nr:TonB-dependent receptor [Gemmatimonadaceae bacterium]MCW5825173.1 TonB-dependent receptor [Gemmatimonadaceae bacterium]
MFVTRRLRGLAATLAVAAGLAATPAFAQGILTGTVIDASNGLTVTGASVRIDAISRTTLTDRTGRFQFIGLPAGEHAVSVRYLGYAPVTEQVTIADGGRATLTLRIQPATTTLGAVVVTDTRTGQAAALAQQLNAPNITNVIAADQIGRFPDANIGDALKRIPGVTVALDQGEARFGSIRGTEPRFNSVMVNGERVPSAEAEVREVQLDLIPADMVQALEVSKTLTPDMDADAIGGAVNVVTRAAPSGFRLSTQVGTGHNVIRIKPVYLGSVVAGNRFFDDRLGVLVSASYYDQNFGSDNKEGTWDRTAGGVEYMNEFDVRRYDVRRTRRSIGTSLDYRVSPTSSVMYRVLYNSRDDWENRFRARYVLSAPDAGGEQTAEIRRQTKGGGPGGRLRDARLEDQRTQAHQFSGSHLLRDFATLEWSSSIARASETRPDERYIEWRRSGVAIASDYSDQQNPQFNPVTPSQLAPSAFTFRRIEVLDSYTKDEDLNGRLDLTLPFRSGNSTLKLGGRYRGKEKLRNNSFDRAVPSTAFGNMTAVGSADFTTARNYTGAYRYGVFSTPEFLSSLDLYNPANFTFEDQPAEYAAGNFSATEAITAGYVQLTQQITPRLSAIVGARYEGTSIDYRGFEYDLDTDDVSPTSGDQSYTDVLPSVHLRWDVDARTVVRAAWTNTLARPNYFDLVPYREISLDDDELATGNPDLKRTRSMNLDLMAERYFESVGLVSAGVFYKDITDFIFNFTQFNALDPVTGNTFSRISSPENGASASLLGFEVAVQRQLDMLPGALKWIGLYANYTFNDSKVEGLTVSGRDISGLPLLGTAQHSGNFSISYDPPKGSVRLAFNYQSESLDAGEGGYNEEAFYDRWADRRLDVDLSANWMVAPNTRFFLEANNLTNRPLRFYQGARGRLMQDEFYGYRLQTGVKFDF